MIMIKSIVSSLIAVSVLATPVAAEARGRDHQRTEHRQRGLNTGEAIALGVGAFILGAAIKSDRNREREVEREVYDREYDYHIRRREYTRTCYEYRSPVYDRYGRFVYNEIYTRCN
jgi:Ni/Co efflux regulator RcnB